jgi:hypothetical protein
MARNAQPSQIERARVIEVSRFDCAIGCAAFLAHGGPRESSGLDVIRHHPGRLPRRLCWLQWWFFRLLSELVDASASARAEPNGQMIDRPEPLAALQAVAESLGSVE